MSSDLDDKVHVQVFFTVTSRRCLLIRKFDCPQSHVTQAYELIDMEIFQTNWEFQSCHQTKLPKFPMFFFVGKF